MKTMSENKKDSLIAAKKFLRKHIKVLEKALEKLSGDDNQDQFSAYLLSWCIHNFMKDELLDKMKCAVKDIEKKQAH